jgi:hypothetical protein
MGIMLCQTSLVFHALQVAPQLVDRQAHQSALILVALSRVVLLGAGLLS